MSQTNLPDQFKKAQELAQSHERILLVSHEYTDGDDLGAVLTLGRVFSGWGKTVTMFAKGGVPDALLFMPGQHDVSPDLPEDFGEYDLLVTVGCGSIQRPGFGSLESWDKPILNIDHHHDTQMFGTVNVWDETMAANCELVYMMLKDWEVDIDKMMAMNLLTGIFTDTGGFRHANVTSRTFEVAADLLRRGAKLDLISRFTFSHKDLPKLKAWSLAIENSKYDPERKVVYSVITEEDLAKIGATEDDLEGAVELLNTIPEAKFSMLLRQRGDEIKGSLRSEPHKGVDVSKIARSFGGGGHKLAAGFKFKGKVERTDKGWRIT